MIPDRDRILEITGEMSTIGSRLKELRSELISRVGDELNQKTIDMIQSNQQELESIKRAGTAGDIGYTNVDDYAEAAVECTRAIREGVNDLLDDAGASR